jgi:tetratricopeptide (TPR) repeat protein
MSARVRVGSYWAGIIACALFFRAAPGLTAAGADPAVDKTEVSSPDRSRGFPENPDAVQQATGQLRREINAPARPAVDQTAPEAAPVSQRNSDALDARLGLIERTLNAQNQRELEALQNSNRMVLIIAGVFAGIGFLGVLFAALILARAMNRLSEIAMAFPPGYGPGHGRSLIALGAGDLYPIAVSQPDQAGSKFLGAIERLEKRIGELEHTTQAPAVSAEINHAASQSKPATPKAAPSAPAVPAATAATEEGSELSISVLRSKKSNGQPAVAAGPDEDKTSQLALLLGKGQALLNLGQAEEALGCFEKAIGLDATSADALVKRGMALEKLQKMEAAIDSYDRAIAANSSMTLAYLYKGAVCNRLQRFREALECYEQALKSEQTPLAS